MHDKKYYLDRDINLLLDENGGELRKLSEAEANLLAEFVNQTGKCLSRDYLVSVGWPNTVVVENSLNMAVRKFRTLGINIETIPRKGYALVDTNIQLAKRSDVQRLNPLLNSLSEQSLVQLEAEDVVSAIENKNNTKEFLNEQVFTP
ncbi:TPA: winged helix-turn-helix domain-containing protein, partial [Vibrio cholerae]|nr:winged helix-turn-helix domain-containing protein [Vibrio cholerae]